MALRPVYMIDPTPGRVGFAVGPLLGCSVNAHHSRGRGVGENRVTFYLGGRSRTIPAGRRLHRGPYPYVLGVSGKLGRRTFAVTLDRLTRRVPATGAKA